MSKLFAILLFAILATALAMPEGYPRVKRSPHRKHGGYPVYAVYPVVYKHGYKHGYGGGNYYPSNHHGGGGYDHGYGGGNYYPSNHHGGGGYGGSNAYASANSYSFGGGYGSGASATAGAYSYGRRR